MSHRTYGICRLLGTMAVVVAVAWASSCKREIGQDSGKKDDGGHEIVEGDHISFIATTEGTALKAGLQGYSILWKEGDLITISDARGNVAVYAARSSGSRVEFAYKYGKMLDTGSTYTAWYPHGIADGYMTGAQDSSAGSISGIPMKAVSAGSAVLDFKNLTGLVKVHLSGSVSNLVALTLASDSALCGEFDTSIIPGFAAQVNGQGSVQITLSSVTDISTGKDFYFAVAEGNYASYCIGLLTKDGYLAYTGGGSMEVRRSRITILDDITVVSTGNGGESAISLTNSKTANCYLATQKCDYKFYAMAKGNRGVSARDFTPASADILWSESTSSEPFSMIKPVIYYNGYVYFRKDLQSSASLVPGNAVVAVRDEHGKVLWSWHIWAPKQTSVSGKEISSLYYTASATVMKYNLGALSCTPGNSKAGGLFYQWGRKDPFPADYLTRSEFPSPAATDETMGTVDYIVSHPMQFVYGNGASCYDWCYTAQDTTVWSTTSKAKALYDPCPLGWRVPAGGGHGISGIARGYTPMSNIGMWNKLFVTGLPFYGRMPDSSPYWNSAARGISIPADIASADAWYPASGFLAPENGLLESAGYVGSCWTVSSEPVMSAIAASSYCLAYSSANIVNPSAMSSRAAGRSVRCVAE